MPLGHVLGDLEHPLEHHRHDGERGALVLGDGAQHVLGREAAAQHQRRAEAQPEREVDDAPGVEHRRRDVCRLLGVQRDLRQQRGDRVKRFGLTALGAFRGAGGPAREDDDAPGAVRWGGVRRVAGLDEALEQRVLRLLATVVPGDEPLATDARVVAELLELVVVDQRCRLLPLDGVTDSSRNGHAVSLEQSAQEQIALLVLGVFPKKPS